MDELTDLVDLGVVDLDLVHGTRTVRAQAAQCENRNKQNRCAAKPRPRAHRLHPPSDLEQF